MKRKAQKTKTVQGTARKDRQKAKPKPVRKTTRKPKLLTLNDLPEPAAWLEDEAKKHYLEICRHLKKVDSLFEIDTHIVSMAANALYHYGKMATIINRPPRKGRAGGVIQIYSNGTRQIAPEFTAMERFAKQYKEFSSSLGLDPKSRENLLAFTQEVEDEQDPISKLLRVK